MLDIWLLPVLTGGSNLKLPSNHSNNLSSNLDIKYVMTMGSFSFTLIEGNKFGGLSVADDELVQSP